MNEITGRTLVEGLDRLGIGSGNVLLIHSSLSSLGVVQGGAHAVIDAFAEVVGPNGIVAMPTHTWGTVNRRQPVFHVRLTPSMVGQIPESFRQRAQVVRSWHPTHSVAAMGKRARAFVEGHGRWSTPCSKESPYGRLVAERGSVILLGVDLSVWTLMHGFEEWAGLP
jgi:aminoglycoside 3-N-acetyltransferase